MVVVLLILATLWELCVAQYVLTIFPQETKLGAVTHYDEGRWTGKNGLDAYVNIPHLKQAGTFAARWLNRDLNDGFFEKAPEDPHRKGYPDPSYFMSHVQFLTKWYLENMREYGNPEIVLETKALNWPHWLPTSQHHGRFPNNVDAAAEFVSLLVQAIAKGTGDKLPPFFEVINEPDWEHQNTNWTTYMDFHKAVANKLKPKLPHLKIGGPTYTAALTNYDKDNFEAWKMSEQYMDMAFANSLDFFSFHSYTPMLVKGDEHIFHRTSEAKLIALLDLIDSYSHKKTNKPFDIIISEYGLAPIHGMDENKPSAFLDWAYIYQHNVQLFTFLERRDIVRMVVAFLMTHTDLLGQSSINYSILDKNHNERDIAQAFKLWKPLTNSMTFIRVDSQFHNGQRNIIPHALLDKNTGTLMILLHNQDKKATQVKLDFIHGWFHPTSGTSTCEVLNAQKKPTIQSKTVHVTNSIVTVPAEASCFYKFHISHNFDKEPLHTQTTYYSRDMVIPIHGNALDVQVNIPSIGITVSARLRIGVSLVDKHANPKPKSVQFNQHTLTSFYSLHSNNNPYLDNTQVETYEYQVDVTTIRTHNDVKIAFAQSGGYVSSVALVLGRH